MSKKIRFIQFALFAFLFSTSAFCQPGIYSESDIEFQSMFMDALIEKHKGNTDKQIEILKDIIKRDKTSHSALFELAQAYKSQENYELAQKNIELAVKLEPTNEWYNLQSAEVYELSSQYEKASGVYSKMISQNEKNPVLYHRLSVNQLRSKDTQGASSTLEKLQSVTGIEEETSRRLFDIYSKSGNQKKALQTLEKLTQEYPDNVRFLNNLAGYQHDIGDKDAAQTTFKKVLELDPDNSQASMAVARNKTKNTGAPDYLSSLMPVIENMEIPLDNKIQELMPFLSKIEKDGPASNSLVEISERLIDLYPSEAKVYSVRGDVLFYTGDLDQSQKMYAKAITLDDRKYTLWDQWMINLWQNNDYNKLETVSYDAIDLFPNQVDAFVMHALSLAQNKKDNEAAEFLEEALFIAGEKENLINIINVAQSWINKQSTENANIKSVISEFDNNSFTNPIYFEILGDLYAHLKDDKSSKKYWKMALELGAKESTMKKKMGA